MASLLTPSIELRHLRYFVAAAEHGSFRKAGGALEVKESSISRSVRDLEDEIGVSLFIRHSRRAGRWPQSPREAQPERRHARRCPPLDEVERPAPTASRC